MNKPIPIDTMQEYVFCRSRGYEPLIDKRFRMDTALRIRIQTRLFGKGHTPQENEKFYRWCWEHYPHQCEETRKPLKEFSAVYISHILTRGAHPSLAHDPRNVNILCLEAHNQWENGNREAMRIYRSNQIKIQQLKKEYEGLSKSV